MIVRSEWTSVLIGRVTGSGMWPVCVCKRVYVIVRCIQFYTNCVCACVCGIKCI